MNPVKQSLNNIQIIQKSVAETPIHEITREVQKVSRLFFSQVESNFSSFDDLMFFSLHIVGLSSLLGSINSIVTLLKSSNLSIINSFLFLPPYC